MDHNEQAKQNEQRRLFSRSDVQILADIRISGGVKHRVRVVDLRRVGFQMECLVFIPTDRSLFLTIPGFAAIACRIAWSNDRHYGCFFEYKLHEAIFDHIVAAHPGISRNVQTEARQRL